MLHGCRAAKGDHGVARRAPGERGASLVEFALISVLLFTIMFGVFEFGLAFNDLQSIRNGDREGARAAVVGQYGSNSTCAITGTAAAAPVEVRKLICLTKGRIGLGNTVRVKVDVTTLDSTPSVRVCAQRRVDSVTGLLRPFLSGRMLKAKVEMRVEKVSTPVLTSAEETAPTGGSWTWCA
jgi:Flp pilus assembly protein TadG